MVNFFGTKHKTTVKKPKESSIFGKKGYMLRKTLLWKLGNSPTKIPGTGKWYNRQKLKKEMGELFSPKRYGQDISEEEAKEVIKKLNQSYYRASWQEKVEITRKIKWLRKNLNIPKK